MERDADFDRCYRCGYALRGIGDERPCPECGLLARRSRRPTDELRYTRPRWLSRVSRGTNLVLLAILVAVASPILSIALLQMINVVSVNWGQMTVWVPGRVAPLAAIVPLAGFDLAALLVFAGAWLLSSPEGYPPADRADRRLRWSLRAAAFMLVASIAALNVERYVVFRGGFRGSFDVSALTMAANVFGLLCIPLPLLLFLVLRGIARRARSPHLAEHCAIVGIGGSAAMVAFLVMGLVVRYGESFGLAPRWIQRSQASLMIILVLFVAALLFAIWSVYLLVRFAVAFRRTSRLLRGAWQEDDRTLGDAPMPRPGRATDDLARSAVAAPIRDGMRPDA